MSLIAEKPTRVRYGVLALVCALSMITYLDRVCFGTVATNIQREFGLQKADMGLLFAAFAFAYAVFEIPTGWLGDRFGARSTLIRVVLWWSAFTALTGCVFPTMGLAFALLLAIRFLFGVGEAGAYPNIARALHNWFPLSERGFGKGAVWMAGRFSGGIAAFIVYALMYHTTDANGNEVVHWRHAFYIFGGIGIIWCVLWWWWYRDNPADNPGVNQAEIAHIQQGAVRHDEKLVVPWGQLIKSGNLWLLCIMYSCGAFGWYVNITYLPGYVEDELHIVQGTDITTSRFWIGGLMKGLPLLVGSVSCLVGGILTDRFIRHTGNRKWGRRLFGVVGHGLCAACYFAAVFFMKSPWAFVILLAVAAFWNDLTMGSAWASCLDIGRRYSGIVAGCMNSIGNLGGALAGITTGMILEFYTGTTPRSELSHLDQIAFDAAKDHAWAINIFLFGTAYVIAVFCWFWFDASKPVVPERKHEPDAASS